MYNKITKKQKQEILDWFNEFVNTIDARLNSWMNTVPKHQRMNLDKSPESLFVLADYIMENFATGAELRDPNVAAQLDAIFTYIGEVHRLHYPVKVAWIPDLTGGPLQERSLKFKARVGFESGELRGKGHPPGDGVVFCAQHRVRETIYKYFNGCANSYKHLLTTNAPAPIPGRGGESYHLFCLVLNNSFDFATLAEKINEHFKSGSTSFTASYHNEKRLLINAGNNYYFHFYLRQDIVAKALPTDICKAYKGSIDKATIAAADTVFEFWGDDDTDLDYFNHHIHIMQFMNSFQEVLIYNENDNCMWEEY